LLTSSSSTKNNWTFTESIFALLQHPLMQIRPLICQWLLVHDVGMLCFGFEDGVIENPFTVLQALW